MKELNIIDESVIPISDRMTNEDVVEKNLWQRYLLHFN